MRIELYENELKKAVQMYMKNLGIDIKEDEISFFDGGIGGLKVITAINLKTD